MTDEMFIPEEDIIEERDGVQFQVAAKGVPMPMSVARARGLVKDQQHVAPMETKAATTKPMPAMPTQHNDAAENAITAKEAKKA